MDYPTTLTTLQEIEQRLAAGLTADEAAQLLGKQGALSAVLRSLGEMHPEQRASVSLHANQLKAAIQTLANSPLAVPDTLSVDMTVPAASLQRRGTVHPTSAIIWEMTKIFRELSFEVVEGPELLSEEENFSNLNIGEDHPAREDHDSFFLADAPGMVLRTQTTSLQVREMRRRAAAGELPIRIVMPGKTYRRESDATHSPMFHQMDAVMVDTTTTFADLKGALDYFVKRLFGDQVETRFRAHHFPFTEPSAEIDIRWTGATVGEGKHTQWLEFGGCGMIHPAVLERAGINPKQYQGWAFGMGVERPLMLRHQIPDLRKLYESDLDFLTQFTQLPC
jgi:phenylalanyl-tRNA synthetase alpha chain